MKQEALNIAIWQDAGATGSILENLKAILIAAEAAQKEKVDILVFPECYLTGYFQEANVLSLAQKVDQNIIQELEKISREYQIALVVGSYEEGTNGVFNSAFFITPHKGKVASYHKRALYGEWERETFEQGDGPVVVEYLGWKIGFLICFDIEFPELVRELATRDADLIIVPTSLMAPNYNVARLLVPSRALENQLFIAYANRIGREQDFHYIGGSSICGPDGEKIAVATKDEKILLTANIKFVHKFCARKQFCYLDVIADINSLNKLKNEQ